MAIQRQLTHVEIDKDLVLAGAQDNALPPPTADKQSITQVYPRNLK